MHILVQPDQDGDVNVDIRATKAELLHLKSQIEEVLDHELSQTSPYFDDKMESAVYITLTEIRA